MKTVVVFQGGGALGAFAAGAWGELARTGVLDSVVAVAGGSIGALNAAVAVRHFDDEDRGAAALEALWTGRMATPAWPFFGMWPMPGNGSAARWNGFLTGLLVGTQGMSMAAWPVWQPVSAFGRLHQPLHSRAPLWTWLEAELGSHDSSAGDKPLLAVAAVDIADGQLRVFDSHTAPVTAQHVAASTALPMLYDPVEVDGRLLWDGEITRESMLPTLWERLLSTGVVERDEPLRLLTLELFPQRTAAPPTSGAEIIYRVLNLQQLGKLEPQPVDGIRIEEWLRVQREPLPEDGVSGQMDYSPDRVQQLLEQGRDAAARALDRGRAAAASVAATAGVPTGIRAGIPADVHAHEPVAAEATADAGEDGQAAHAG